MKKIAYDELEDLVSLYQEGSKDAAEQLLYCYHGYINKHVNIFKGQFDPADKTQRNFVRLFIRNDEHRSHTHRVRRSENMRRLLLRVATEIRDNYAHLDPEELRNEMIALLLDMASHHNGDRFHIYIAHIFPRKFYKIIRFWKIRRDQISFDESKYEMSYDDPEIEDESDKSPYRIQTHEESLYDENWVNGYECDDLFASLSIYERRILKWYYEHKTIFAEEMTKEEFEEKKKRLKKTEQEIADYLGCSRKTINQKRNEVKRKIEALAKELYLLG